MPGQREGAQAEQVAARPRLRARLQGYHLRRDKEEGGRYHQVHQAGRVSRLHKNTTVTDQCENTNGLPFAKIVIVGQQA